MPILTGMEAIASSTSTRVPIDLDSLAAAFNGAAAAAADADTASEAIDRALEVLHDDLNGAGVAAFVLEHGRIWSVGVRGYAMIPDGLSLEEGVTGRAVRTSELQFAPDASADPDFIEVVGAVASELAIPLVTDEGVVGVLNIETATPLPAGAAGVVGPLLDALAGPIDELRASRTVDVSTLARLFVYMSSLRDHVAIAEVAVRSLARVLPLEASQLLLLDEEGRLVEATEWCAAGGGHELVPLPALEALRGRIEASAVFELLDASTTTVPELDGLHLGSIVLIPLRANGSEIGMLVGSSRFAREFDRVQGELAALLAAHAAASLDAAIALDRERRSAHTDPLTGLLNRRGLENLLEGELGGAQEVRQPLSLVVLDFDDFKDVNDRAGHEFGDALLREVGLVLGGICPEGAAAARIGGDEFVVMLPGMDADAAVEATERLRVGLGEGLDDAGFPLRLSAGISTYPYDGAGTTQLLRAADQALYRAKARGKNRVIPFREVIRGSTAAEIGPVRADRSRGGGSEATALADVMDAANAIDSEATTAFVLERLTKTISFVVGATGTVISRIDGARLRDVSTHALRDISLGEDDSYVIADYPVTQEVLETRCVRSLSFLDDDLDSAEAFVLRELQMNAAMLLPLVVHEEAWGLVEIYDMRMRRFTIEEEAVAQFLVAQAGKRIEMLDVTQSSRRRLRRLRQPA
jgi:diguanylate cyclase (GGDEF)-like protein